MDKPEVKFGDWIQQGWEIYKANFGLLVLAGLIQMALSSFTLGILAGPMAAGMILIVLRLVDADAAKPQPGDIFQGFNLFLPTFLFTLVWGAITLAGFFVLSLIPCLGSLVAMAGLWVLQALLMFGLFLIADRGMDFWPASMESMQVVKSNFFPFLGLMVVASLIGSVGSLACGIGVFLTMPLCFCILAVAYRAVFSGGSGDATIEVTPQTPETEPEAGAAAEGDAANPA